MNLFTRGSQNMQNNTLLKLQVLQSEQKFTEK